MAQMAHRGKALYTVFWAASSLFLSLSLSGCIMAPPKPGSKISDVLKVAELKESSKNSQESPQSQSKEPSKSDGKPAPGLSELPADPGPFKLIVDKEGREFWQARGELGKFGGTLRLSSFGDGPKTFNAWDASDVESHGIGLMQFDSLVDIDPWTGKTTPKLCKEVTVSPDGKVVTFKLRKGLLWSDGKPITADDIVFTFDKLVKDNWGEGSNRDTISIPSDYPTIAKVDDLTATFTFKKPFSPLLLNLNALMLAPKHVMEPVTKKGKAAFRPFWNINCDPKTIVGSGPFILSSYIPSQRVEFRRNPNYHMVDSQGRRLPYLDKIVISIVKEQPQMILKFLGKEVDLLDIRSVRGMDAAVLRNKEKELGFTLRNLGPDDGTVFLMFNMNQRKNPKTGKYYVDPIKQEWFNSTKFRWAVSHAIDRNSVVNNILRSVGFPLSTCQTTASAYHNSELKPIECDLEKSKALLKEDGFVLKNNELFDKKGNRVEFDLMTNAGNTIRDAVCIHIKEQLRQLGIKVNYQPVEFNAMLNRTHTSLDWQAIMLGLSGSRLEPYSGANIWKSDGRMHEFDQRTGDENGNIKVTDARPWELEIDKCLDQAAGSYDEKVRTENYRKAETLAYENQPFIYIYSGALLTAASNKIGNYKPTPLGTYYTPKGTMHNLEEIYLKEGQ